MSAPEVNLAVRAKDVFADALERPEGERGAFVEGACAGDAGLRALVDALLAAHGSAWRFMHAPSLAAPGPASPPLSESPGTVVGRYKLLQLIGEGGFGSVFLAEQREPVVRRVALKIIKLGMDTRQVIARFEAERQALAMMDHPNIAKVLDAGATDSGRPYFVMELVRGDPITTYCDAKSLGVPQRLELFEQVCHAVQHAHQNAHRRRLHLLPGQVRRGVPVMALGSWLLVMGSEADPLTCSRAYLRTSLPPHVPPFPVLSTCFPCGDRLLRV